MIRPTPLFVALFVATIAARTFAQGNVIIVDDSAGPGVDATDIQTAINTAASGDMILMKSGIYSHADILGKGLTIIAESGATVQINGMTIRSISANESVLLRGLDILSSQGIALLLQECAGPLWIEDCRVRGRNGIYPDVSAKSGVIVDLCSSVAFLQCTLDGGRGADGNFNGTSGRDGAPALRATGSSQLQLYNTILKGGDGGNATDGDEFFASGGDGGSAAEADGCVVFASKCLFAGADGGWGGCGGGVLCGLGGLGGNGLVSFSNSVVSLLDVETHGGLGGENGIGIGNGQNGNPMFTYSGGTITQIVGTARSLITQSPVREGQTSPFQFTGLQGDAAFVIYSSEQNLGLAIPELYGVLLPSLNGADILDFGTLVNNTLTVAVSVPFLPPTVKGVTYFLQSIYVDASFLTFTLGGASAVTVLDSGF